MSQQPKPLGCQSHKEIWDAHGTKAPCVVLAEIPHRPSDFQALKNEAAKLRYRFCKEIRENDLNDLAVFEHTRGDSFSSSESPPELCLLGLQRCQLLMPPFRRASYHSGSGPKKKTREQKIAEALAKWGSQRRE